MLCYNSCLLCSPFIPRLDDSPPVCLQLLPYSPSFRCYPCLLSTGAALCDSWQKLCCCLGKKNKNYHISLKNSNSFIKDTSKDSWKNPLLAETRITLELHLPHTFGFPSLTTAGQQVRTAGQDSRAGQQGRAVPPTPAGLAAPAPARQRPPQRAPLCSAPFPCSATAASQRYPAACGPAALPVWLSRGLPLPLPAHGHTDGRRSSLSPTEATSDPTTQRRTTCAAPAAPRRAQGSREAAEGSGAASAPWRAEAARREGRRGCGRKGTLGVGGGSGPGGAVCVLAQKDV